MPHDHVIADPFVCLTMEELETVTGGMSKNMARQRINAGDGNRLSIHGADRLAQMVGLNMLMPGLGTWKMILA
jgi:hypothetical protein